MPLDKIVKIAENAEQIDHLGNFYFQRNSANSKVCYPNQEAEAAYNLCQTFCYYVLEKNGDKIKKFLSKMVANITFQIPVLIGLLLASGVPSNKIPTIVLFSIPLMHFTSPMSIRYQNWLGKKIGLNSILQ